MASKQILLIEDDNTVRFAVSDFLTSQGYEVSEAETCAHAEERFRATRPDVVILDYELPDGNALELLPRLLSIDGAIPILILTGHGTIDLAVRAMKAGAENFLTKPVELSTLLIVLQRLLEHQRHRRKYLAGKAQPAREEVNPFVGVSTAIRQLSDQAQKVQATDSPVLIRGETGTGKGVLAKWLHQQGPRGEEAWVDLNCAGLSRDFLETELFGHERGAFTGAVTSKVGLLEVAHRGTVFLDEIGDVDPQVQPKLLKVLEEKRFRRLGDVRDRQVDVRLIAATHHDLYRLVQERKFRSDLYFRINTLQLVIPTLRDRIEDIPVLARVLLERLGTDLGVRGLSLTPEAITALQRYPWPGNVRELRNVLERAILLSNTTTLQPHDFHFEALVTDEASTGEARLTLQELEQRHIERALHEAKGRVSVAAQHLGIPRSSLYQKLKHYGIVPSEN